MIRKKMFRMRDEGVGVLMGFCVRLFRPVGVRKMVKPSNSPVLLVARLCLAMQKRRLCRQNGFSMAEPSGLASRGRAT